MKEQNKTPERELNRKEISKLSGAELKILVIRMLKNSLSMATKLKRPRKK